MKTEIIRMLDNHFEIYCEYIQTSRRFPYAHTISMNQYTEVNGYYASDIYLEIFKEFMN